ncbi:hypothetical protein [Streptomyces sp. CA-111067]|jgi:hypothetical protein|uniref:hypothetical protein n=1 Tax=Streptomyces sp. CA-111067 TaxID=3240046 RepID=UPI003D95F39A
MSDEVTRVDREAQVDPGAEPVTDADADEDQDAQEAGAAVPLETPEADAVEQRKAVPLDEEDYR